MKIGATHNKINGRFKNYGRKSYFGKTETFLPQKKLTFSAHINAGLFQGIIFTKNGKVYLQCAQFIAPQTKHECSSQTEQNMAITTNLVCLQPTIKNINPVMKEGLTFDSRQ